MALYKVIIKTVQTIEGIVEAENADSIRNTVESENENPTWWGTKAFSDDQNVKTIVELKEIGLSDV